MAITTIGGTINSTAVTSNLDYKYGPYSSKQEAYDTLGPNGVDKLAIGLTVGIIEEGRIREYWFRNDISSVDDLVLKSEGPSAYDIAVEEGYSGTEEQWIASLKGETGTPGHNPNLGTYTTSNYQTDAPTEDIQPGDFISVIDNTDPNNVTNYIYTWNGSAWTNTNREVGSQFATGEYVSQIDIENFPNENSGNVVSSGGIFKGIGVKNVNSQSLSFLANNKIRFLSLTVTMCDNSYLTIYANEQQTYQDFQFDGNNLVLVVNSDGECVMRASIAALQKNDTILLGYGSANNKFSYGLLLPLVNRQYLDGNIVAVNTANLSILSDNSIQFNSLTAIRFDTSEYITIYANEQHTQQIFTFGSDSSVLVIDVDGNCIMRASISALQPCDTILLGYVAQTGKFTFGLLLPLINQIIAKDAEQILKAISTISPEIEIGRYTNNGVMTEWSGNLYQDKTYWRTKNYIKILNPSVGYRVRLSSDVCFFPIYYDKDYQFVGCSVPLSSTEIGVYVRANFDSDTSEYYFDVTADNVPPDAAFMKFCFRSETGTSGLVSIDKFFFYLEGCFSENWNTKNVQSRQKSGHGYYQPISVLVNVTNPNSCNDMTADVQDSPNYLYDHGVFCLPKQYSNTGEPTRLIMYCHGAGKHYTSTDNRFGNHLNPELWLSEGFAIVDMEGNPYNDTDDHGYIPAAKQTYEATYRWILEHYNIYPEVFVAGKSMGGGLVFDLLVSDIPIIAAGAIVPVCNYVWWWEYMNANRRAFVAEKLGFVGTAPTWTGNSPMTNEEWQYFSDNYDKWVSYNPFTRLLANPPSKTEILTNMNLSKSTAEPTADETNLWKDKIAKSPCPVKIWISQNDTSVIPTRNGAFMYQMLKNGSSIVEYRQFLTGGHHIEQPDNGGFGANYVNSYGETITDAPVVFIELLNFWRRYI